MEEASNIMMTIIEKSNIEEEDSLKVFQIVRMKCMHEVRNMIMRAKEEENLLNENDIII